MDDDSNVGTALSRGSALAPLFCGRFCDVVLGGRPARVFEEDEARHVEIGAYLTQEEVAQMVMARRERVSTALNALRRRGIAQYSTRGRLILDMRALDDYVACLT